MFFKWNVVNENDEKIVYASRSDAIFVSKIQKENNQWWKNLDPNFTWHFSPSNDCNFLWCALKPLPLGMFPCFIHKVNKMRGRRNWLNDSDTFNGWNLLRNVEMQVVINLLSDERSNVCVWAQFHWTILLSTLVNWMYLHVLMFEFCVKSLDSLFFVCYKRKSIFCFQLIPIQIEKYNARHAIIRQNTHRRRDNEWAHLCQKQFN